VHAGIAFFLTPFVLASLGPARYGVWALLINLSGYYGLLDLGFRAGLTQYMTRYLALGRLDQVNRCASSGFTVLGLCGGLILLASLAVAAGGPLVFEIPPGLVAEPRWAAVISAGAFAFQFLWFSFAAVFTSPPRSA